MARRDSRIGAATRAAPARVLRMESSSSIEPRPIHLGLRPIAMQA